MCASMPASVRWRECPSIQQKNKQRKSQSQQEKSVPEVVDCPTFNCCTPPNTADRCTGNADEYDTIVINN